MLGTRSRYQEIDVVIQYGLENGNTHLKEKEIREGQISGK